VSCTTYGYNVIIITISACLLNLFLLNRKKESRQIRQKNFENFHRILCYVIFK